MASYETHKLTYTGPRRGKRVEIAVDYSVAAACISLLILQLLVCLTAQTHLHAIGLSIAIFFAGTVLHLDAQRNTPSPFFLLLGTNDLSLSLGKTRSAIQKACWAAIVLMYVLHILYLYLGSSSSSSTGAALAARIRASANEQEYPWFGDAITVALATSAKVELALATSSWLSLWFGLLLTTTTWFKTVEKKE